MRIYAKRDGAPLDTGGLSLPRPRLTWGDFHTVLAVAQDGSVAKACTGLGITHSTLLRKLELIERRLKTRLFERMRGRYTPTAAGQEIIQAARAIQPIAAAAETRVSGQDLRPSGEVRVSVASVLINHLLPAVMSQFSLAFPEIEIELVGSRDHVSLQRREADVAIRIADEIPTWLVGRKLADLHFKIYGQRRGQANSLPRRVEELARERRWISFERHSRDLKFDRWLTDKVPDASVVLRVDNFSHALTMVKAGLGIALLPAFIEGCVPELCPLTAPIKVLQTPLWMVTHPELQDAMRVKVLVRAFGPALANSVQAAQDKAM